MKKEFAKWVGLMLIICQLTIPAYAGTSFPDVPDTAPYADAVSLMKEYGIFNGDANGNFNPNAGITRAEFAAVVCRAVSEESEISKKVEAAFADVPSNHWAAGYINWGVRRGILNGYGQGVFGLQDKVTYEQAIKVIVSVMGFENDAKELGGYPGGYITVAKRQGYLDGVNQELSNIDSRDSKILGNQEGDKSLWTVCPQCGEQYFNHVNFCRKCGTRLGKE